MANEKKNESDNKEYKEGYEDGRSNSWFQSLGSVQFSPHGSPYRKGLQTGREDRWKYGNTSKQEERASASDSKGNRKPSPSYTSDSDARYRSSKYSAPSSISGGTSFFTLFSTLFGVIFLLFIDLLIFVQGVLMLQAANLAGIFLVIIGIPGGVIGYLLIGVAQSKTLVIILDKIFYVQASALFYIP